MTADDYDGWMSKLLWFDLDNLPPVHERYGMSGCNWWNAPRERNAHSTNRMRDMERVIRDQQQHIRSLEAQLLPNLIREVPSEQDAML